MIGHCASAIGIDAPHEYGPRRAGDAVALVSGSQRACDELGWIAERLTLGLMFADPWRWHQTGGYSG
ncbi:hypothetical protein [Roseinatronobacter bogoriensis]|uniref:Uncharacterized protein n=1 Tax=Roseinatronobacter bogoriensis subsp. barguzinensis TaxID=441209 RepID=A0A2K8KA86_9RHOB|nr:hypothetical protein [Rhodobaca]ATX65886.1 hypothetical protein BG454_08635 [Rhodobaca barguzinensis]